MNWVLMMPVSMGRRVPHTDELETRHAAGRSNRSDRLGCKPVGDRARVLGDAPPLAEHSEEARVARGSGRSRRSTRRTFRCYGRWRTFKLERLCLYARPEP